MGTSSHISLTAFRNLNVLGLARRFLRKSPLSALPVGATAPEIVLKDTYGQTRSLEGALKKGPAVVAFFKVNCTTSQFTFPFLQRIYEMYGGPNFTIWGISQNHRKDTQRFMSKFSVTFPVVLDAKGYPASNEYGVTNSPTSFLILPTGTIQISSIGFSKADLQEIVAHAAGASQKPIMSLFHPGEAIPLLKPG